MCLHTSSLAPKQVSPPKGWLQIPAMLPDGYTQGRTVYKAHDTLFVARWFHNGPSSVFDASLLACKPSRSTACVNVGDAVFSVITNVIMKNH